MAATAIKTVNENQKLVLSQTQREILLVLQERGDESRIGEICSTRMATIRALERLERLGLIVCVVRPPQKQTRAPRLGTDWKPADEKCGVWRLTAEGEKAIR